MKPAEEQNDPFLPELGKCRQKSLGVCAAWNVYPIRNHGDRCSGSGPAIIRGLGIRRRVQTGGALEIAILNQPAVKQLLPALVIQSPAIKHSMSGNHIRLAGIPRHCCPDCAVLLPQTVDMCAGTRFNPRPQTLSDRSVAQPDSFPERKAFDMALREKAFFLP